MTSGVCCAAKRCVAVARHEAQFCAVHAKLGPDFWVEAAAPKRVSTHCETCDGDGDCIECGGTGECSCHCGDEHDCHECDGTGECSECEGKNDEDEQTFEQRYVAWAFDVGLTPLPPVVRYPWDEEAA